MRKKKEGKIIISFRTITNKDIAIPLYGYSYVNKVRHEITFMASLHKIVSDLAVFSSLLSDGAENVSLSKAIQ